MTRYGVYSVNGKTGSGIQPVRFQPGQTVRLRFVNAGNLTHYVHPRVPYRIVGLDGSELTGGRERGHALPWDRGCDDPGSRPFVWTASAESILAKLRVARPSLKRSTSSRTHWQEQKGRRSACGCAGPPRELGRAVSSRAL